MDQRVEVSFTAWPYIDHLPRHSYEPNVVQESGCCKITNKTVSDDVSRSEMTIGELTEGSSPPISGSSTSGLSDLADGRIHTLKLASTCRQLSRQLAFFFSIRFLSSQAHSSLGDIIGAVMPRFTGFVPLHFGFISLSVEKKFGRSKCWIFLTSLQ